MFRMVRTKGENKVAQSADTFTVKSPVTKHDIAEQSDFESRLLSKKTPHSLKRKDISLRYQG